MLEEVPWSIVAVLAVVLAAYWSVLLALAALFELLFGRR